MHNTESELRHLEERVYRLPVDDLERRVAALEQGTAQQSARAGGVCIRTWDMTVIDGHQTLPLPGVTVTYGPDPYDPLSSHEVGVTDGSGHVSVFTVDQKPTIVGGNPVFPGGPYTFTVPHARFDQGGYGALPNVLCGAEGILGSWPIFATAASNYCPSGLLTPYPLKLTLAITVPSLGLTAVPLTNTPPGGGGFGTWTTGLVNANYPGGGAHGCAAVAVLPLTINYTGSFLGFVYRKGGAFNCPQAAGGGFVNVGWFFGTPGVDYTITGDGNLATSLTIVSTAPAGSFLGDLFPAGAPTVTIYEV